MKKNENTNGMLGFWIKATTVLTMVLIMGIVLVVYLLTTEVEVDTPVKIEQEESFTFYYSDVIDLLEDPSSEVYFKREFGRNSDRLRLDLVCLKDSSGNFWFVEFFEKDRNSFIFVTEKDTNQFTQMFYNQLMDLYGEGNGNLTEQITERALADRFSEVLKNPPMYNYVSNEHKLGVYSIIATVRL